MWKTAILSHFLLCDWFEMVKFEFCVIINHIIPIFVDLVALERIFLQFAENRVAIFKICRFEPLLAMGSIPNGQIWNLYHQKPQYTHFHHFFSAGYEIIDRNGGPFWKYVISRSFRPSESLPPLKFRFAIPKNPHTQNLAPPCRTWSFLEWDNPLL